jgi:hypothetical protein
MFIKRVEHFSARGALLIPRVLFENNIVARRELSIFRFGAGDDEPAPSEIDIQRGNHAR